MVWVLLSMFSIVWMTSFGDSPTTPAWPLLYRLFQTKAGRVASMRGFWRRKRCASRERWEGSQMAGGEMIWHYGNRILPSNFCFTLPHGHSTADFLETNPFTCLTDLDGTHVIGLVAYYQAPYVRNIGRRHARGARGGAARSRVVLVCSKWRACSQVRPTTLFISLLITYTSFPAFAQL